MEGQILKKQGKTSFFVFVEEQQGSDDMFAAEIKEAKYEKWTLVMG